MKFIFNIALVLMMGCTYARAQMFGNLILDRAFNDSASGVTYIWIQSFSPEAIGGDLASWSFFDNDDFSPDRQITPLLLEQIAPKQFILRGVGETRTTTESGVQTFDFSAQVGSATILSSDFLFGWKDGSPTTHNQGAIDWDDGGPISVIGGDENIDLPSIGSTLDFSTKDFNPRTYSFDVTVVPEPSVLCLLALGIGVATFRHRRRYS